MLNLINWSLCSKLKSIICSSFFLAIFLSGCGQTYSLNLANLFKKTFDIEDITKTENKYEKDYEQMKINHPIRNISYVQPNNKKVSCKIFTPYTDFTESNEKVIWDGSCKNGFAYGLGRIFIKNSQRECQFLVSIESSKKLKILWGMANDYSTKKDIYVYGDVITTSNDNKLLSNGTLLYFSPDIPSVRKSFYSDDIVYSKNIVANTGIVSYSIKYPNYNKTIYLGDGGVVSYMLYSEEKKSFDGLHILSNPYIGKSLITDYSNNKEKYQDANLTDNLLNHLITIAKQQEDKFKYLDSLAKQNEIVLFNTIKKYSKNLCKNNKITDGISKDNFFKICSFSKLIAQQKTFFENAIAQRKQYIEQQRKAFVERQIAEQRQVQAAKQVISSIIHKSLSSIFDFPRIFLSENVLN